jgi:hypothetical protein
MFEGWHTCCRLQTIVQLLGSPEEIEVGGVEGGLLGWVDIFRMHQVPVPVHPA